jgi:hypothetical protein
VTAPAVDEQDAIVGSLAVLVPTASLPAEAVDGSVGGAAEEAPDLVDTMVAETGEAAKTYTRLLIDLLGEVGRIDGGRSTAREGQSRA